MARTYRRDARGRFAGGGYSGQTGGRGARLTASGTREGGGARVKAAGVGGTVGKPRGLKPDRNAMVKSQTNQRLRARAAAHAGGVVTKVKAADLKVGKKAKSKTPRQPKTGRDVQMAQIRKVQNQKLRDLNRRIKEAGPSAGALRLEKLKLQDAMRATAPRRS